jgi:catechol 2,3-dioxygenase-like lactoylglutathione lyase family enzyme
MTMSHTPFTFGVDHLQLPVARGSLATAREFYEHHLGLTEVRDPALDRPGTLRFALGGQRLDLVESDAVAISPHAHLALRVIGVDTLAAEFSAAGVPVDDVPLGDRPRIYVIDPFGHRLELIEATPPWKRRFEEDIDESAVGG